MHIYVWFACRFCGLCMHMPFLCNTLTATHCNTLQHTHSNILQRSATHCNTFAVFVAYAYICRFCGYGLATVGRID